MSAGTCRTLTTKLRIWPSLRRHRKQKSLSRATACRKWLCEEKSSPEPGGSVENGSEAGTSWGQVEQWRGHCSTPGVLWWGLELESWQRAKKAKGVRDSRKKYSIGLGWWERRVLGDGCDSSKVDLWEALLKCALCYESRDIYDFSSVIT